MEQSSGSGDVPPASKELRRVVTARDVGGGNRPAKAVDLRCSGGDGTTRAAATRETEERARERESSVGLQLRRGSPARLA